MNTDLIEQSISSLNKSKEEVVARYWLWDEARMKLTKLPQNEVISAALNY